LAPPVAPRLGATPLSVCWLRIEVSAGLRTVAERAVPPDLTARVHDDDRVHLLTDEHRAAPRRRRWLSALGCPGVEASRIPLRVYQACRPHPTNPRGAWRLDAINRRLSLSRADHHGGWGSTKH
jgi:hypothetical protein